MTRRELRENCFKMLFCADFYPEDETYEQLERYFQTPAEEETTPEGAEEILHEIHADEKDQRYLTEKAEKVLMKIPELDKKINEVTEGWRTRRMGKVELTILRLALYEIQFDEDIPPKVAINEAVELAKKFGGDESSSFVNGILAKLV